MSSDQKPLVYVIGTGGSISFVGDNRMDFIDYSYSGKNLSIQEMLDRVPEVNDFARIKAEQYMNVGSADIYPPHWLELAKRINQIFRETPEVAGVAVSHGTATLEETAYFLNLTVKSDKPVVVTAAMRPPTGLSTDADINLINCIQVAACPQARGKGVLSILNNEIQAARDVTKADTHRLQTFKSSDLGILGYADSDHRVVFYRAPTSVHTQQTEFSVDDISELPRVDIVYSYAGADGLIVRALVDAGVPGIVVAGLGAGSSPPELTKALGEASERGVVVVLSSQVGSGRVIMSRRIKDQGVVVSDNLAPKKARILLMLALTVTKDIDKIQQMAYSY